MRKIDCSFAYRLIVYNVPVKWEEYRSMLHAFLIPLTCVRLIELITYHVYIYTHVYKLSTIKNFCARINHIHKQPHPHAQLKQLTCLVLHHLLTHPRIQKACKYLSLKLIQLQIYYYNITLFPWYNRI